MTLGLVVVGAGGHAKVCIELFRAMGESVDYCIGAPGASQSCVGVPVLAGDAHIERLRAEGYRRGFVALGDNQARQRLAERLTMAGMQLVNAISPSAVVSPSVLLGHGVAVMAGAVINAETVIGDLAIVNTGATIDHDCVVGSAVHIAPQSALAGSVRVGRGSFIGLGAKVIPGVCIGEQVMIGAGGVVIADVPDGVTAVGVPTRIVSTTV